MKKKTTALMLCLVLALSCLGASAAPFTDSVGREIDRPESVSRIAATGPLAQIALFAVAPDMLVGVSSAWDAASAPFAGDYAGLPVLGQLYGGKGDINLEQLAASDPQLIIDVGEPKGSVAADLDALQGQIGIPFVHITMTTQGAGDAFRTLGKLLGRAERAEEIAAYCDEIYARVQAVMEQVGVDNKARMLYCLGENGLNVVANGSYHAEILDMIADNLAVVESPSSRGTGNEVDLEQLLLWDPDYILFAPDSVGLDVASDPAWQSIPAVAQGNTAVAPIGPYNWLGFPPSVQRYLGMLWMCKIFYPDVCTYDMYEEAVRYFGLFYHHELTRAQYDELTANAFFQ